MVDVDVVVLAVVVVVVVAAAAVVVEAAVLLALGYLRQTGRAGYEQIVVGGTHLAKQILRL